jgi:hypothetical protein
MTAFMIDEMLPVAAAALLRDTCGHDAVHVAEAGLRAAEDAEVASAARAEGRAVVTGNVADFSAERDVVLVFVLKKNLPPGGEMAAGLAKILDLWAQDHHDPYLGPHWPAT